MARINLRKLYNVYQEDCFIEVSEELFALLQQLDQMEQAQRRKQVRYRAYLSLDRGDGIERDFVSIALSPEDIYEEKVLHEKLHMAISSLSEKQAKRIFAHFFLNMSKAEIARAEGVGRDTVGESIRRGLFKMKTFLKNLDG